MEQSKSPAIICDMNNGPSFEEGIIFKNNDSQNQIRASVGETLGLQEEQVEVIKLSRAEVNSMTQAYKEMNSATLSVNQNLNAANTSIQGFKSEQIARGFTQALSAVTSLAFGIQSITS